MVRVRPRRPLQAPLGVRVVRIAAPAIAAGALITTVAVTAWPSSAGSVRAVRAGSAASAGSPRAAAPSGSASVESLRSTQAEQATAARTARRRRPPPPPRRPPSSSGPSRGPPRKKKKAAELDLTVVGSRYTTAALKLRTEPSKSAKFVDVVDEAEKIKITDTVREGYRLVVVSDKGRWVTNEYLSKKKPTESAAGVSDASCSKSADTESGLVSNGVKVYRAMCAAFPEVSSSAVGGPATTSTARVRPSTP